MTTELILPQEPILLAIEQDGMELQTFETLKLSFNSLFDRAEGWRKKALEMAPITSPDQKREMKLFRESRLALREIRIEVENKRKLLVEDGNRRNKAINGISNVFKALVEPIEEYLEEQEKFAERHEALRIKELGVKRFDMLAEYGDASCFSNLGTMEDTAFSTLLDNLKLAKEAREGAARKLEQERIEREIREVVEQKRLAELQRQEAERIELERQKREEQLKAEKIKAEKELAAAKAKAKKEKDALEAQILEERKEAEVKAAEERAIREEEDKEIQAKFLAATAKAKAEREEMDLKFSKELAARQALERRQAEVFAEKEAKAKAEAAARKKAENAPNKEKLEAFGEALRAVKVPTLTGDCEEVQAEIEGALQDLFILIKRVSQKI